MLYYGKDVVQLTFIDTRRLCSASDALGEFCAALRGCQDEVSSVQKRLADTVELEIPCSSLDKAVRRIECQLQVCRRLYQSVESICQAYDACENRVLDYCENGIVRYEQPPAEFYDLSSAIGLLQELSFLADGGETGWDQTVLK